VLHFNHKEGKYQDSLFLTRFPLEKSLRTLLVGSHQQKNYTLMSLLQNPRNKKNSPLWLPFAEKGSDEKVKNRREDMLRKELLRRWKRRPFYNTTKIIKKSILNKNQDKKIPK